MKRMLVRQTSSALFLFAFLCLSPLQGRAQMVYVPEGDVAGTIAHYKVKKKDTLYNIARQFDVGIVELLAANPGIDPWIPKAGTRLTIPSAHVLPAVKREGIVINLSELRLYYFYDPQTVMSFPVGIGMDGWLTPTGATEIVKKRKDPSWTPPDSIREEDPDLPDVIPAGPDNPLGAYAMNLGLPGYLIHGTNRPYGIGKRSSHGCIRLYPEDISLLFNIVKEGTPVTIIDMPFALGWRGDDLYLEVSPTPEQADRIAQYKQVELFDLPEVYYAVEQAAGKQAKINWPVVKDAVIWRTGIPVVVATKEE
ncbi:MAG: L,D-transpeptidase family protein [Alphaproteobacteria bacterium]|nr:L,D-transpeptidase family protein [Alphaproteobacteria bacterium]